MAADTAFTAGSGTDDAANDNSAEPWSLPSWLAKRLKPTVGLVVEDDGSFDLVGKTKEDESLCRFLCLWTLPTLFLMACRVMFELIQKYALDRRDSSQNVTYISLRLLLHAQDKYWQAT